MLEVHSQYNKHPFQRKNGNHNLRKKIADGSRNYNRINKSTKTGPEQNDTMLIRNVFDIETPRVNEDAYKLVFSDKLFTAGADESELDIARIPRRKICKLMEPLSDSFDKTEKRVKGPQAINSKDVAMQLVEKHKRSGTTLKLNNSILDIDTMEVHDSMIADDSNVSFSDTLKKRFTRDNEFFNSNGKSSSKTTKKMKKPKILKSDGQTVTAESVMRMVDPSFSVCSDADDTSMISVNNSMLARTENLKLTNVLDDLKKIDPIDQLLAKRYAPSGLRENFSLSDCLGEDDDIVESNDW